MTGFASEFKWDLRRAIQFSNCQRNRPQIRRIKQINADQNGENPPHPFHLWSILAKTE